MEQPREAVLAAGAETELLSIESGEIQAMNHDIDKGDKVAVDRVVSEASPDEYDGLILPGGVLNPDNLRQDENAIGFVQEFFPTRGDAGPPGSGTNMGMAPVTLRPCPARSPSRR